MGEVLSSSWYRQNAIGSLFLAYDLHTQLKLRKITFFLQISYRCTNTVCYYSGSSLIRFSRVPSKRMYYPNRLWKVINDGYTFNSRQYEVCEDTKKMSNKAKSVKAAHLLAMKWNWNDGLTYKEIHHLSVTFSQNRATKSTFSERAWVLCLHYFR